MHRSARNRGLQVCALLLAVLLAGCSEEAQQDIIDAVEDAMGDSTEGATETPTEDPAPTDEPAPTEEATEEPVPTEEPVEEPEVTEEPVEEPEPTDEAEAEIPFWVWILAAVVLLLLVWAVVAAVRRRRMAAARRARLRDAALAETEWLLGAAREQPSSIDAAGRARDVRMRFDRLTDALQQLRTGARADVVQATTDLQTSARHLADALVARLDEASDHRGDAAGFGIGELAQRVAQDRDAVGAALGLRPEHR